MGSKAAPPRGQHVSQLVRHADALRREARAALRQGDHARAAALLDAAETLAADVRTQVDAMEERQAGEFALIAAEHHAARARPRPPRFGPRAKRLGAMLGAGLAISLALAEF